MEQRRGEPVLPPGGDVLRVGECVPTPSAALHTGQEPVPPPCGVVHLGGEAVVLSCAMMRSGGEPIPASGARVHRGGEPVSPPCTMLNRGGEPFPTPCAKVHREGEHVPPPFVVVRTGEEPVPLPGAMVHKGWEPVPPPFVVVRRGRRPVPLPCAMVRWGVELVPATFGLEHRTWNVPFRTVVMCSGVGHLSLRRVPMSLAVGNLCIRPALHSYCRAVFAYLIGCMKSVCLETRLTYQLTSPWMAILPRQQGWTHGKPKKRTHWSRRSPFGKPCQSALMRKIAKLNNPPLT